VVFLVGGQRLGGLRQFLSCRAEVFERMLNGSFREAVIQVGAPLPLPQFDHCPRAFREFLVFVHSGRASLRNTLDVMYLYEISQYFDFVGLRHQCLKHLEEAVLDIDAATPLLSFAGRHELSYLRHKVSTYIIANAEKVLANPKVSAQLPTALLRELFQSEETSVSELALFLVVLELDPKTQQELVPLIRLPLIPTGDIMKIVLPSGLFSQAECLKAVAFQADPCSVEFPVEAIRDRSNRHSLIANEVHSATDVHACNTSARSGVDEVQAVGDMRRDFNALLESKRREWDARWKATMDKDEASRKQCAAQIEEEMAEFEKSAMYSYLPSGGGMAK